MKLSNAEINRIIARVLYSEPGSKPLTVHGVRAFRMAGYSYAAIAKAHGVNKGSVHNFAKKHDLLGVEADPELVGSMTDADLKWHAAEDAKLGDYSGLSDADLQVIEEAAEPVDFAALVPDADPMPVEGDDGKPVFVNLHIAQAWTDHGYDKPEECASCAAKGTVVNRAVAAGIAKLPDYYEDVTELDRAVQLVDHLRQAGFEVMPIVAFRCEICGCNEKAAIQRADGSPDGRLRCVYCKTVFEAAA